MRQLLHIACIVCMCAASLTSVGCGRRASVDGWQKGLEQYAHGTFNDDMSFLRDRAMDGRYPRFAMLGDSDVQKSTDVAGVLLTRRTIGNRDWLIFLLAKSKNGETQDIRIAALSDDADKRKWVLGESAESVTHSYLQYRESQWRRVNPDRERPPLSPDIFPAEGDVFRVDSTAGVITVLEERSGARWTLVLHESQAQRR